MTPRAKNAKHFPSRNDGNQEPVLVHFPNALRNDGLADTYLTAGGESVLLPNFAHDFDFSARLATQGLSRGVATSLLGRQGIRYPADADLVNLSAVMNAAVQSEDGRPDIVHSLRLVGETAKEIQRTIGAIPMLISIEAVAIDRTTSTAELLAPYEVSDNATPVSLFDHLLRDAYQRSRNTVEYDMITQCFAAARESFTE